MADLPKLNVKAEATTADIQAKQINSQRLSRITAIITVVFLAVYILVTTNSRTTINDQVETVSNGPYPVSLAAGHVETLLTQLRTVSERAYYLNTDQTRSSIQQVYNLIDPDLSEKLTLIDESHSIFKEDGDELRRLYDDLKTAQLDYLQFLENESRTPQEIWTFLETHLFSIIDEMTALNLVVLEESTNAVDAMYNTVENTNFFTSIVTTLLIIAVFSSLLVYMTLLNRYFKREKQLRDSLEQAVHYAENANDAKSLFLSNMSHDIRTPMNAIVGLTTIASANLDDRQRVQDCLARIAISSKHLLGLINDILDMGKIERGKLTLNEEEFSLPDLISEFISIITPQVRAKHLNFDVVIDNIQQEMLYGDTIRINQILLNLLSNAIKYTHEGGTVKFSLREESSEKEGFLDYRFIVADTGIGMDENFIANIFEPFERERNETTNFTEGTGLGLAITKNAIDLMGGTIDVKSKPGIGSVFNVVISLRIAQGTSVEYTDALKGVHLLLVDDDAEVLNSTVATLQDLEVRVDGTTSSLEAIALTIAAHDANDDYDAIIVDWMMPEMDGLETVRRIRETIGDSTPIILISAYDWTEIEDAALELGIHSFISKPLFKSRLYETLCALLVENHDADEASTDKKAQNLKGRVLLVEDNELNSEIACELISTFGAEIDTAFNGAEAVKKVDARREGYYDLIFMDWQMPQMNGIEATKMILAHAASSHRKAPPIVAMTANAFDEHRAQALQAGMSGFLTKPINVKELGNVLRQYLISS